MEEVPAVDSFFQSIADALNVRDKNSPHHVEHTVASLRADCRAYAVAQPGTDSWMFKALNAKHPAIPKDVYLVNMQQTIDLKRPKRRVENPERIAGHELREGPILCEKYKFTLKVNTTSQDALGVRSTFAELINKDGRVDLSSKTKIDINTVITLNCDVTAEGRNFSVHHDSLMLARRPVTLVGFGSDAFDFDEPEARADEFEDEGANFHAEAPAPYERYGLFEKEDQHAEEKLKALTQAIPPEFDVSKALGNGDCFFDSVASELNRIVGRNQYNRKTLRMWCLQYVQKLHNLYGTDPDKNWVFKQFHTHHAYQDYLENIGWTADDIASGLGTAGRDFNSDAVWGQLPIDGRIILETIANNFMDEGKALANKLSIHVMDVVLPDPASQGNFIACSSTLTLQGENNSPNIDWNDPYVIHLAACNVHFVPIQPAAYIREQERLARIAAEKEETSSSSDEESKNDVAVQFVGTADEEEFLPSDREITDPQAYLTYQAKRCVGKKPTHPEYQEAIGLFVAFTNFLGTLPKVDKHENYELKIFEDGFKDESGQRTYLFRAEKVKKSEASKPATEKAFNPREYTQIKDLKAYVNYLAEKMDEHRGNMNSPQFQYYASKIKAFEAFMDDLLRDDDETHLYKIYVKKGEEDEANYFGFGSDFSDAFRSTQTKNPDAGGLTRQDLFTGVVYLNCAHLLWWAMWFQGAGAFFEVVETQKQSIAVGLGYFITAIAGKDALLIMLGQPTWKALADSVYDVISTPVVSAKSAITKVARGQMDPESLYRLMGWSAVATGVGGFFTTLIRPAAEDLVNAIIKNKLTGGVWDFLRVPSQSNIVIGISQFGSMFLNAVSVTGTFLWARYEWQNTSRDFEIAFRSGGSTLERARAFTNVALSNAFWIAFTFQGLGINFFDNAKKEFIAYVGPASGLGALIPLVYITMLDWAATTALTRLAVNTTFDIASRRFSTEEMRAHNGKEFSVKEQIAINTVSMGLGIAASVVGSAPNQWQQTRAGQPESAKIAGLLTSTRIETLPLYAVTRGWIIEPTVRWVKALFTVDHDAVNQRAMLPEISDNPEEDKLPDPVEAWKALKEAKQARKDAKYGKGFLCLSRLWRRQQAARAVADSLVNRNGSIHVERPDAAPSVDAPLSELSHWPANATGQGPSPYAPMPGPSSRK